MESDWFLFGLWVLLNIRGGESLRFTDKKTERERKTGGHTRFRLNFKSLGVGSRGKTSSDMVYKVKRQILLQVVYYRRTSL